MSEQFVCSNCNKRESFMFPGFTLWSVSQTTYGRNLKSITKYIDVHKIFSIILDTLQINKYYDIVQ
jgi:hypothetical protein